MQRLSYLTLSCFIFVINNVHYIQEKVQKNKNITQLFHVNLANNQLNFK